MKTFVRLLPLLFLAVLTACQPLVTPSPVPASTPKAGPTRVATPAVRPTATAAPAATPITGAPALPASGVPAPSLFDVAWDDRSVFRSGLVAAEQDVLAQPPGASVYHIDIELGDDLTSVQGREEVRYTNAVDVPLSEVTFRLFPNLTGGSAAVSNVALNGQPVEPSYTLSSTAMIVSLPQPLQPGQEAVFGMDFDVTVPTDQSSNYGTFAYLDDVLALAHFYPMIAVYDDEGWNAEIPSQQGDIVYADAADYLVRITAPKDLVIAASGVTVDRQEQGDNQVLTLAAGPARDFYLAASDRYQVASGKVGETTINSYASADDQAGSQEVLDFASQALNTYERLVGPYPYTELDVVSTPTSALGVEYPGIVAITERIYDDNARNFLESTVAHEVGHQWFYNAVGNDQVDEPWLDESLTQYATLLYFKDNYGQAGEQAFRQSLEGRWERVERAAIPIGMPVDEYTDKGYGAIVYGRGALFFEALQQEMGQAAFDAFLKDYYQTFQWHIATTESLRRLAEKHCGCDLGKLFEEWVYGSPQG